MKIKNTFFLTNISMCVDLLCVCSFSRSFSLYITFFKARRVEFAKSKKKIKRDIIQ